MRLGVWCPLQYTMSYVGSFNMDKLSFWNNNSLLLVEDGCRSKTVNMF